MSGFEGVRNERRSTRWRHLREAFRSSLWLVPALMALGTFLLLLLTIRLDIGLSPSRRDTGLLADVDDARSTVTLIGSSMLTIFAVVFSMTLVALQLASSQYSPRILRNYVRSTTTKVTIGLYLSAFVGSLEIAAAIDSGVGGRDQFVPVRAIAALQLLAVLCLFAFIAYVHSMIRGLRVGFIVDEVARETRHAIDENFPLTNEYAEVAGDLPAEVFGNAGEQTGASMLPTGPPTSVVRNTGRAGVVLGVETDRLVAVARRHDTVLVLRRRVGSFLGEDDVLVECFGGSPVRDREIRRAIDLGPERTLYQDANYGFRLLVDIAIKALSPAVNDPTTAVQVIDRLTDLLQRIAERPQPNGIYLDVEQRPRLFRPMPSWEQFVDLAFEEMIRYGDTSPQISRRLMAAFDDLLEVVPPELRPAVDRKRQLLIERVNAVTVGELDRQRLLTPDRRGLG